MPSVLLYLHNGRRPQLLLEVLVVVSSRLLLASLCPTAENLPSRGSQCVCNTVNHAALFFLSSEKRGEAMAEDPAHHLFKQGMSRVILRGQLEGVSADSFLLLCFWHIDIVQEEHKHCPLDANAPDALCFGVNSACPQTLHPFVSRASPGACVFMWSAVPFIFHRVRGSDGQSLFFCGVSSPGRLVLPFSRGTAQRVLTVVELGPFVPRASSFPPFPSINKPSCW